MTEELRALALAATQGPWIANGHYINAPHKEMTVATVSIGHSQYVNTQYIAAASPDVVLGLLDEIDRLNLALLSASEGAKDREHAEKYFRQAEKMLTGNERTLMAELDAVRAEVERLKEFEQWYTEAMVASNEAGYSGASATETIKDLQAEVERLREENLALCATVEKIDAVSARLAELEKPQAQRLSDAEVSDTFVASIKYCKTKEGIDYQWHFARAIENAFAKRNGINLGE